MPPTTLSDLVARAIRALAAAPNMAHPREAERLALAATGRSTVDLVAHPDAPVTGEQLRRFEASLSRRLSGEPLQYIFGEWDFHGRTFRCDRRALVPRPETELVIEILGSSAAGAESLIDLGTGTGILAVTARLELPSCRRVVAVDLSPGAASLAASNARQLGAEIDVVVSNWDEALAPGLRFDVLLSNPPYVDEADAGTLAPEVRDFEPHLALFSPGDPLAAIRAVLGASARRLVPGGLGIIEIGAGQAEEAKLAVLQADRLELVEIRPDLAGIPRAVVVRHR